MLKRLYFCVCAKKELMKDVMHNLIAYKFAHKIKIDLFGVDKNMCSGDVCIKIINQFVMQKKKCFNAPDLHVGTFYQSRVCSLNNVLLNAFYGQFNPSTNNFKRGFNEACAYSFYYENHVKRISHQRDDKRFRKQISCPD